MKEDAEEGASRQEAHRGGLRMERRMQRSGLAGDSRRGDQCGGGRGGNVCPLACNEPGTI